MELLLKKHLLQPFLQQTASFSSSQNFLLKFPLVKQYSKIHLGKGWIAKFTPFFLVLLSRWYNLSSPPTEFSNRLAVSMVAFKGTQSKVPLRGGKPAVSKDTSELPKVALGSFGDLLLGHFVVADS